MIKMIRSVIAAMGGHKAFLNWSTLVGLKNIVLQFFLHLWARTIDPKSPIHFRKAYLILIFIIFIATMFIATLIHFFVSRFASNSIASGVKSVFSVFLADPTTALKQPQEEQFRQYEQIMSNFTEIVIDTDAMRDNIKRQLAELNRNTPEFWPSPEWINLDARTAMWITGITLFFTALFVVKSNDIDLVSPVRNFFTDWFISPYRNFLEGTPEEKTARDILNEMKSFSEEEKVALLNTITKIRTEYSELKNISPLHVIDAYKTYSASKEPNPLHWLLDKEGNHIGGTKDTGFWYLKFKSREEVIGEEVVNGETRPKIRNVVDLELGRQSVDVTAVNDVPTKKLGHMANSVELGREEALKEIANLEAMLIIPETFELEDQALDAKYKHDSKAYVDTLARRAKNRKDLADLKKDIQSGGYDKTKDEAQSAEMVLESEYNQMTHKLMEFAAELADDLVKVKEKGFDAIYHPLRKLKPGFKKLSLEEQVAYIQALLQIADDKKKFELFLQNDAPELEFVANLGAPEGKQDVYALPKINRSKGKLCKKGSKDKCSLLPDDRR